MALRTPLFSTSPSLLSLSRFPIDASAPISDVALAAAAAAGLPTSIPALASSLILEAGGYGLRPGDAAGAVLRDGDAVSLGLSSAHGGLRPAKRARLVVDAEEEEEAVASDPSSEEEEEEGAATTSTSSDDDSSTSSDSAGADRHPITPAQGRRRPGPPRPASALPAGGPSRATRRRAARRAAGRAAKKGGESGPELKGRVAAAAQGFQPGGHIRFGRGGAGAAEVAAAVAAEPEPLPQPTGAPVATRGATSAHGARAGSVGSLLASLRRDGALGVGEEGGGA